MANSLLETVEKYVSSKPKVALVALAGLASLLEGCIMIDAKEDNRWSHNTGYSNPFVGGLLNSNSCQEEYDVDLTLKLKDDKQIVITK